MAAIGENVPERAKYVAAATTAPKAPSIKLRTKATPHKIFRRPCSCPTSTIFIVRFTENRDNKTAIELFLVGVRGWYARVQQFLVRNWIASDCNDTVQQPAGLESR